MTALRLPEDSRREPTIGWFRPAAPDPLRPDPLRRDAQHRLRLQRARLFGPLGSLLLHLLVLVLLLVDWHWASAPELEQPIPVALVIESAPPEPAPAPAPAAPPKGRLASEDYGDPDPKTLSPKEVEAPTPAETPAPAAPTPPPPPPLEVPQQTAAADVAVPPPPPKPKPAVPVVHQMPRPSDTPARMSTRRAKYPGPAASRDEYLAYLVMLARQHINLLTHAMVGGRRGMSVIGVTVLDDGTIARINVARGSGYPDIDERVEQMILACGRFPPLPQWFQGEAMQLEFRLEFPDALDE